MAKNLLKQVMIKDVKEEKMKSFDTSGITEKINSGYIVGQGPKFTKKKSFAPSAITYSNGEGSCPRYWYLAFDGADFFKENSPFEVANMTSGVNSHSRIQKAMMNSGIAKIFQSENRQTKKIEDTTEFPVVFQDPPIYGYGDCMLVWEGEEIVGEIKTTKNEVFEYWKKTGKPKDDHVEQVLIYMRVLGKQKGVVIYENKNTHELLIFPIIPTEKYKEWVNATFEWMRTVHSAWRQRNLPKKNYKSNSKVCKVCPVKEACSKAGDGVISIASLKSLGDTPEGPSETV